MSVWFRLWFLLDAFVTLRNGVILMPFLRRVRGLLLISWGHVLCVSMMRLVTLPEVKAAEVYASGHVDYGATWAYRVAEKMTKL